ncbi:MULTISPECIES: ABC transporter permease [Paenibacillus]|uniref:ABC transporter permease n=1 Tax=Paenibacillus TaxID=44249 RepID=UPI0004F6EC45|nr:ABC transporter permease [Paenibacillus odorifer]AIQ75844.1 peptide permease [Paenibacillus odorifer]
MINYIIRRLLISVPVLFGVTLINYFIIQMAPGSPADMYISPQLSAENIANLKDQMGLNDPVWLQYFKWLGQLFQGNLGYSLKTNEPVIQLIGERILPTLLLTGSALIIGLLIALPLGIISAIKRNTIVDYCSTGFSFLGFSIPTFFLGLVAIFIFALQLNLLPSGGMKTLGNSGGAWDIINHLILPACILSIGTASTVTRYVRSSMIEILGQDYMRTARAKGLKEFFVIGKHALRNGLIPILTLVGLSVGELLGGAAVTEQVFQWPGLGQLTIQSILSRDYPVIMGISILAAIVMLAANLITDILYSVVDPRIKYN